MLFISLKILYTMAVNLAKKCYQLVPSGPKSYHPNVRHLQVRGPIWPKWSRGLRLAMRQDAQDLVVVPRKEEKPEWTITREGTSLVRSRAAVCGQEVFCACPLLASFTLCLYLLTQS